MSVSSLSLSRALSLSLYVTVSIHIVAVITSVYAPTAGSSATTHSFCLLAVWVVQKRGVQRMER